jgi:hypothetical protein
MRNLAALFLVLYFAANLFATDSVWVRRSVTPSTIYYEGAGAGDTAIVNVRAWASKDSLILGATKDVLLLTDNSSSMVAPGAYIPRPPIGFSLLAPITRIQGTYNACVNFIDSTMRGNDRIAHMRFAAKVDTSVGFTTNYAYAKGRIDTMLTGWGDGTSLYASIYRSLHYLVANRRDTATAVLIAMTDGWDNVNPQEQNWWDTTFSEEYPGLCGSDLYHLGWIDSLGPDIDSYVARLLTYIDSLNNAGISFKLYTIQLGSTDTTTWDAHQLQAIAQHGNGEFAASATGGDLDQVFQSIGHKIYDVAAIKISTGVPMLSEVLATNIHYVPNSLTALWPNTSDSINYIKTFSRSVTTVNTYKGQYTRLDIILDTIKVGQILEFQYKITAALHEFGHTTPQTALSMPINNLRQDDTAAYSRAKYKTVQGVTVEKPILPKCNVGVMNKVIGVFISKLDTAYSPADLTGNRSVTFSYNSRTAGAYGPFTLFALQREEATGASKYTAASVQWRFAPNPGWTLTSGSAMNYSDGSFNQRNLGLSVQGDAGLQDQDTVWIRNSGNTFTDYLVIKAVYVDQQYVADYRMDPISPVPAGTALSVTWKAVDQASQIVTNPALQPDSVCVYADLPVRVVRGPGDTLTLSGGADKYCGGLFTGGVLTTQFYSTVAESLTLTFVIYDGNATPVVKTVEIGFTPGAPDHVRLVYQGTTGDAGQDTLSSFGADYATQRSYSALLYDRFNNPITAQSLLNNIAWQANQQPGNLTQAGTEATYNARGTSGNYWDTVVVSYMQGTQVLFRDAAFILVLPIVRVLTVSTHEWIPEAAGPTALRFVLDTVLSVSTDSLNAAAALAGVDQTEMVLRELNKYGYARQRDGYLDYLDIALSSPIALSSGNITGISFDTLFSGRPDTITWAMQRSLNGRTIAPRLAALDGTRTRYRLWLVTNAGTGGPRETSFLPKLRFDNTAIQNENAPPLRLGNAENEYRTSASLVVDSAAPVVDSFIYQNNKCNQDRKNNSAQITFSEPVRLEFGQFTDLRALALIRGGAAADSTFTVWTLSNAYAINTVFNPWLAWNLEGTPGATMAFEVEVQLGQEDNFTEGESKIRFSADNSNQQILDAAGNSGCRGANLPASLQRDRTKTSICNLVGTTQVNRYAASTFNWTSLTGPDGRVEEVPSFAFFGFEVNMSLLLETLNGKNPNVRPINCGDFIILDYLPSVVLVSSEVRIYDLLGNMVVSPTTNRSLKIEFTVNGLKKLLDSTAVDTTPVTCGSNLSNYSIHEGVNNTPDTLKPMFQPIIPFGYEEMKRFRGTGFSVLPTWNCLNAKGRLVAPGGYIVVQTITALNKREQVTRKLIVTSKRGAQGF